MLKSLRTTATALCLALGALTAQSAQAQDTTTQRFVFLADDAIDSPATSQIQIVSLMQKVMADARNRGFNYGDIVQLATIPGGSPDWDTEIEILASRNNHPGQVAGFLSRRLTALGEGPLRSRSDIIWALQALNGTCDGGVDTHIYVFLNGISAVEVNGDDVKGNGTAPGALAGCTISFVGLGLSNPDGLSLTARLRLDDLFGQIAEHAGAGDHDILR